MSDRNLLRVADGSPITSPSSKEMALGVYFLTADDPRMTTSNVQFADVAEAMQAYQSQKVDLKQIITVRVKGEMINTTIGRIMFNEVLPEAFGFINQSVNSSLIKEIVTKSFTMVSEDQVVRLIDDIKDLGFIGGTMSGLSFGVTDAQILPGKDKIIDEANRRVSEIEENFAQGLITVEEKRRLTQEVWIETTEEIADKTWEIIEPTGSIRVVIDAKVGRTSRDQIKQLAGMRGLVTDPTGKIVELPIKSNFREGLSVFEYVASGRGSRKGLTDSAIKTADAGYLTRRLVDVTHDMLVRVEDCGVKEGLEIRRDVRTPAFAKRIFGRFAAEEVKTQSGEVLVKKGEFIDEDMSKTIEATDIASVVVRSPLTCWTKYGVCQKCYGWDLSDKKLIQIGVPAGVIAAQSIGEPGTQLTLRTKHSGGVIGVDVTQGLPRVEELFEARVPKILSPIAEIDGKISVEETEAGWKVTLKATDKSKEEREYLVPKASKLVVEEGQLVAVGTQLASGSLDIKEVLTISGLKAAQEYLVNELQAVYESQGIPISDKHFEVIIRKMTDEVKVSNAGDTTFLPGDIVDKAKFEEENEQAKTDGKKLASGKQIISGITKRALHTDSWLSAASFEQTTDILTDASLRGRVDRLLGLKENVIIGRLIPVSPDRMAA